MGSNPKELALTPTHVLDGRRLDGSAQPRLRLAVWASCLRATLTARNPPHPPPIVVPVIGGEGLGEAAAETGTVTAVKSGRAPGTVAPAFSGAAAQCVTGFRDAAEPVPAGRRERAI
jgi:hypothetical protein